MRGRPRPSGILQPATEQEFAQPMATALHVLSRVIPRPHQVAGGFFRRRRRPYLGEQTRPEQLGQLASITPVGLNALTGLPRDQGRSDHLTLDAPTHYLPLQRVSARAGFVAALHRPGGLAFQLPHKPRHRRRLVLQAPLHGRGHGARQHRHVQLFLVRIDPDVRDNVLH
jgi:hypothetical protein